MTRTSNQTILTGASYDLQAEEIEISVQSGEVKITLTDDPTEAATSSLGHTLTLGDTYSTTPGFEGRMYIYAVSDSVVCITRS